MSIRQHRYCAYYCEENAWHLAGDLASADARVVVVTNPDRTCALWNQRAARAPDQPVVWDYHVFVVAEAGDELAVFDLDSTLGFPCGVDAYLDATFPHVISPHSNGIPARFAPRFRVFDGDAYRRRFRSDRSHMRDPATGQWRAPPPSWPPLLGVGPPVAPGGNPAGEGDAADADPLWLASILDLSSEAHGAVLELDALPGALRRHPSAAPR